ncbi:endonuclease/exonuclease/phosphatase family protein [Streptococcus phocae subsp. phocae]
MVKRKSGTSDFSRYLVLGQMAVALLSATAAEQVVHAGEVDGQSPQAQQLSLTDATANQQAEVSAVGVTEQELQPTSAPEKAGEVAVVEPEQEKVSDSQATATTSSPLSDVRNGQEGLAYTVSGQIISKVNAWGGNGFYLQDNSGQGLYVYPKNKSLGYQLGDRVTLTGTLKRFRSDLQLVDVTDHKSTDQTFETSVTKTSPSELATAPLATMVELDRVTVGEITNDSHNTATFTVSDDKGQKATIRLDNRTGMTGSDLLEVIDTGDVINVSGILSLFDNNFQIKPFDNSHFQVIKKLAPQTPQKETVTIGDIQGKSHQSPYNHRKVTVKDVVVTYLVAPNNFYVQDLHPDGDSATSDGINVISEVDAKDIRIGDVLTLTGSVEEHFGKGYSEKSKTDLTITRIKAKEIEKTGTAELPKAIVIGKDRKIPADIIDNDGMTVFDPEEDALDFWESVEGMLVAVDDAKIVGPMKHKEIYVLPGSYQAKLNNMSGINLKPNTYNTGLVPILFKSGKQVVKAGDFFTGRLVGPVTYSYTNYKVYVNDETMPTLNQGSVVPEKTYLAKDENRLSIASYNIENFSADKKSTPDSKVKRIAQSFISDLQSPDIIGLIEVQDNNGPTDDGTTDASQSAARLIKAITDLGGPAYTYVDIAPENNQDGGQPGGNIRVAFLYNKDRVSLSDKPKGTATQAVAWENGELNLSVGRIDPTNPIWETVRKSLAAEFIFKGQKVVVLANHLNSKRGDNGLYGRVQPVTFKSEERRHQLSKMLADFAKTGLAQNANVNIVMLGDFNDYEFTKTISLIETGGMSNLVSRHDEADRFSYFYQGNNQTLDNVLISNNLLGRYAFDMVHVNSPFMEEHGRASDHDPLLLQLELKADTPSQDVQQPKNQTPQQKSEQSEVKKDLSPSKATVSSKASKQLPSTGDTASRLASLFGFSLILATFFGTKRHKKNTH